MRQVSILAAAVLAAGSIIPSTAIAEPITPELAAKHERDVARRADINGMKAADTDVFFLSDSSTLAPDATKRLTSIVRWAEKHPCGSIVLDAHTDPRGSEAHNVRLSAQRAEAVRDLLISLGVEEDRIVLGLFGENAPRRASYAQDRRVTASVTEEPLYEIVDEKLDAENATALVWSDPVTIAELEGPNHPATVAAR